MAKGFLILDKENKVYATHSWGGMEFEHCPLDAPEGGKIIGLSKEDIDLLVSLGRGGQPIEFDNEGEVKIAGITIGKLQNGKLNLYADNQET